MTTYERSSIEVISDGMEETVTLQINADDHQILFDLGPSEAMQLAAMLASAASEMKKLQEHNQTETRH